MTLAMTALERQVKLAQHAQEETYYDLLVEHSGPEDAVDARPHLIAHALGNGECYVWAQSMQDLVRTISESLPEKMTFSEDLLPTPDGVFHLATPVLLPMKCGEPCDLPGHPHMAIVEHIAFATWNVKIPGVDIVGHRRGTMWALLAKRVHGPPIPYAVYFWPFGDSAFQHRMGQAQRLFRWVGAALLLMNQRIIETKKEPVRRETLKRLQRAKVEYVPSVNIVTLRRTAKTAGTDETHDVEWHHRWVVSGHWRQQAYGPHREQRRPIWILPHIKGPESKPLKMTPTRIFSVSR